MRARLLVLGSMAALAACSAERPAAIPAPPVSPPATNPPAGMQYLYGSGEAAALSAQVYRALVGYAAAMVKARPTDSVVLAEGATLAAPTFAPCGDKPFAAMFDVDETVMLNTGFEYHDARTGKGYDAAAWDAWEKTGEGAVGPVPGADRALAALRAMGVTVVFNTNRSAANADATVRAIRAAGLGEAVHGQTLFLSGDDAMGSRKDGRRATIAARYCVIAMGGDQLGDFSDLFNGAGQSVRARRAATMQAPIAGLWGNGWFVLPNPVYGSGLKGGFDEVFPADTRWTAPVK
ncbi:5'-nucleotidase, lipoprotein e(P4) family [Sphingobium sp. CAP-1]|uniref:5'-nucleotidase, lipoprotein e(P4) family n=1 Tax=Sphingobium sp. CAP-1 TaxID=2676077 RepID=UPI0012BB2716|nr:HAD family acid phosphatase [Sphingobium sp. CAP-1]QGP77581.1 acid phosphatase [Sphingobium sp. CAP-1]